MDELEMLKKENEILKNQIIALKYWIPKSNGDAEPEEFSFEIERLAHKRFETMEKWELVNYIWNLYKICHRLRDKLQIQRQYNNHGWRANYLAEETKNKILHRNYLKISKENEELKERLRIESQSLHEQCEIVSKQVEQIEKMKNCGNCKYKIPNGCDYCGSLENCEDYKYWRLAE